MSLQTTYTQVRANLATLLDDVAENREVVIIKRRGSEDVAMIAADELAALLETVHLLRSPNNAKRLLASLQRARQNNGMPQDLNSLRCEIKMTPAM